MTVEELERNYKFNETNNELELQHQEQRRLPYQENVPFEVQNFFQQQQQRFPLQQHPDINNLDPMAVSTFMHQAAFFQQNMINQQQQQQSSRHPMIQKLLSNSSTKSLVYIFILLK